MKFLITEDVYENASRLSLFILEIFEICIIYNLYPLNMRFQKIKYIQTQLYTLRLIFNFQTSPRMNI